MNETRRLYILLAVLAAAAVAAVLYYTIGKPFGETVKPVTGRASNFVMTWCDVETLETVKGQGGRGPHENPKTHKLTMYSSMLYSAPSGTQYRVYFQYDDQGHQTEFMVAKEGQKPDGKWQPFYDAAGNLTLIQAEGAYLFPAEKAEFYKSPEEQAEQSGGS